MDNDAQMRADLKTVLNASGLPAGAGRLSMELARLKAYDPDIVKIITQGCRKPGKIVVKYVDRYDNELGFIIRT